jgi:putative phage-type endonuclease
MSTSNTATSATAVVVCPAVERMRTVPFVAQKSEEWLRQRDGRLTASEFASCLKLTPDVVSAYMREFKLGPDKKPTAAGRDSLAKFIRKKVGLEAPFTGSPATMFGQLFEPVALNIYSQLQGAGPILEFGMIPHPTHDWLGASPDGVHEADGRLVEIKCPFSRTPDGVVPFSYWCQMQHQMECCDAESCDFFDAHFVEHLDAVEWRRLAREWRRANRDARHHEFGLFLTDSDGMSHYAPKEVRSTKSFLEWEAQRRKDAEVGETLTTRYYQLVGYHLLETKRNRQWFAARLPELRAVWDQVVAGRTPEGRARLEATQARRGKRADTAEGKAPPAEDVCPTCLFR